jgi:diguanylate cyclase (GGDEF)-like protein
VDDIIGFLGKTKICAEMSGLELIAVSAFLEPRRLKRGEHVFKEGDLGREMFLVYRGRVISYLTPAEGERRVLGVFEPGRFFGEMAVIEGAPRSASCLAETDAELLVLEGIDFFRLVWEHPMIGVKLLRSMSSVMIGWLSDASGFLTDTVRWGETARKRAITDSLSGLFNRRFMDECLKSRLSLMAESFKPGAYFMMDLDHFRDINAHFGPAGGDSVIKAVAGVLSGLAREGDITVRLSGDEFAMFLPETERAEAEGMAAAIVEGVGKISVNLTPPSGGAAVTVGVTMSVGALILNPELSREGPERVVAKADAALYAAKEAGRNQAHFAE